VAKFTKSEIENLRIALRHEMHQHLPKWRTLARYIAPKRLKERTRKVDGRRRDEDIINNQAGRSLRTFVSGMMNGATPRTRPWFNLTTSNHQANQEQRVKKYFTEVEKILNTHFQISNLYRTLPIAYKDLGVFSNSAFAMLPHAKHGFYFYPFAIGTYAFACDREGTTNMFTRDFTLNIKEIVQTYGQLKPNGQIDWVNIPNTVRNKWDQKHYLEEVLLSQVIVPNPSYDPTKRSLNPEDKKFISYTYVQGYSGSGNPSVVGNQSSTGFRQELSDFNQGEVPFLKVSGYNYFPVITPRWEIEAEGYYGIDGPGEVALSDIMTLQREEAFRFEGVEKLIRPPMVGHASLRRYQSSILAGGITYVDDRGMAHGFKPAFELNPQLSELVASKEEIQMYIKEAFYEDLFRQMSARPTVSHVTKAEIDQRSSEAMAAITPVLGQTDEDMTSKIIDNAILILGEQAKLPERPRQLINARLMPEYISVLAQASRASLLTTQERVLTFTSQVAQALQEPSLLKIMKAEDHVRFYAENAGLDPNLILDEREFGQVQEASNQAQLAQIQADQQAQGAQTAKTLSETQTSGGSLLDQLVNQ
jgi:hypothetical protein